MVFKHKFISEKIDYSILKKIHIKFNFIKDFGAVKEASRGGTDQFLRTLILPFDMKPLQAFAFF